MLSPDDIIADDDDEEYEPDDSADDAKDEDDIEPVPNNDVEVDDVKLAVVDEDHFRWSRSHSHSFWASQLQCSGFSASRYSSSVIACVRLCKRCYCCVIIRYWVGGNAVGRMQHPWMQIYPD